MCRCSPAIARPDGRSRAWISVSGIAGGGAAAGTPASAGTEIGTSAAVPLAGASARAPYGTVAASSMMTTAVAAQRQRPTL